MPQTYEQQIVVVGALAYDQISTTRSRLTGAGEALLNCKLDSLDETVGGCAGNIAYNLAHLSTSVLLISITGGADDQPYLARLVEHGIDNAGCLRIQSAHTARAVIITDVDGHQFTGFFPGPSPSEATWTQHLERFALPECRLFIQAPYPPAMMLSALQFAGRLPHPPLRIWCPGQYADQLSADAARQLALQSDWIIGNVYELGHLSNHAELADKTIIRTNSAAPVEIRYPGGRTVKVAVPAVPDPVDPTGCGDAFIAGLTDYLVRHSDADFAGSLPAAVAAGNSLAARCLLEVGGQNHHP